MYIYATGVEFHCESCNIGGRADLPADFVRTHDGVFIECPVCGNRVPVDEVQIPDYLKQTQVWTRIRYEPKGIMTEHF